LFGQQSTISEYNKALKIAAFEFVSSGKYVNSLRRRLGLDSIGFERLQIEGTVKHS
jgi:hypothetical protein